MCVSELISLKFLLSASGYVHVLQGASDAAVDVISAGIPIPVRRGMKLLAPSILRLCNVVLTALEDEDRTTVNAVQDLCATTLGVLQNRRAYCIEELQRLKRALSFQETVYNGLFKCEDEAVGARKKARRELKEALQAKQKAAVIENLTANEEKSYRTIWQFVDWYTIAKKAKEDLQCRYKDEEMALADVDNDIEELKVLDDLGTRTADSRTSNVEAFMVFVASDPDSSAAV